MARRYENGLINPALSVSSISLDHRRSNTSINAIGNNLYDEAESSSTYNTLHRNADSVVKPNHRRGHDVIYDNVGPATQPRNKNNTRTSNSQSSSHKHVKQRRSKRNSIIRVVLMFFIVFVAAVALLLAILLMMGKVGPDCSCDSGSTSNTGRSTQTEGNGSPQPANTFSMDLTPFHDILDELQANLSSLSKEAESILEDSVRNKEALLAAKKEFNSTRDAVDSFSNMFYGIVDHVNNSVQQFDPDHGPAFARLQALNETLTNELEEIKRTSEQYNDVLDKAIDAVNSTISEQVNIKISLPGPIGERGKNGSKGPTGDAGPAGLQGPQGFQGPQGPPGEKGIPGENGFPGTNGSQGAQGAQGSKGIQGDQGINGTEGPQGNAGQRGIGNFSWCEQKEATVKMVEISPTKKASASDTQDYKIISASCTSVYGEESNLQVTESSFNEYSCVCKGFSGPPHLDSSDVICILYYLACPIQAP